MKKILTTLAFAFLGVVTYAQDATCLDTYYYSMYMAEGEGTKYELIMNDQTPRLFCSNSSYIDIVLGKSDTLHVMLDSMTYQMQTEFYSVFSYAAHTNDCKFAVTFSFSKKAPTQDRYMVRVENLTVPILHIFHINPESL